MKTDLFFPTWESFIDAVTVAPVVATPQSVQGSRGFTGTACYNDAVGLATTGWSDGLAQINRQFAAIKAALPSGDDFSARFTEAGDEVDVGLFLEGEPEHMIEYNLQPRQRPVVRLVVSITYSSGISTDVIFRRGAVVMTVVDGLEAAGVRCEIVADFSASAGGKEWRSQVVVKAADASLDRDRVAFALCHPAMLRRLCFRLNETVSETEWENRGGMGYGSPIDPKSEENSAMLPCLMYGEPQWSTVEAAAKESQRLIEELSK